MRVRLDWLKNVDIFFLLNRSWQILYQEELKKNVGRGGLNASYSFVFEIIQTILRMILGFSNGNNVFLELYMRNIDVTG